MEFKEYAEMYVGQFRANMVGSLEHAFNKGANSKNETEILLCQAAKLIKVSLEKDVSPEMYYDNELKMSMFLNRDDVKSALNRWQ